MKRTMKLALGVILILAVMMMAACEPKTSEYKVTFTLGQYTGSVSAPPAQTVKDGESIKLPSTEATIDGYTFEGWTIGDSDTIYKANDNYTVTGDVTFTAKWTKNADTRKDVTVSFSLGSGVEGNPPAAQTVKEGEQVTMPSASRSGYTLDGWKLDGDDKLYAVGEKYTATENVTFTAQWTAEGETKKDVTVSFSLGSGVEGNPPAAQTVKEGEQVTLPSATRSGYTLDGWKLDGDDKLYAVGDKYTATSDVTFTAQWTKNSEGDENDLDWLIGAWIGIVEGSTYSIEYDGKVITYKIISDGALQESKTSESIDYDGENTVTVMTTDKFEITLTKISDTKIILAVSGSEVCKLDKSLAPEKQQFTVHFELGDDVNGTAPSDMTVKDGENIKLPETNATKDGFEFGGWTIEGDDENTVYAVGDEYTVKGNVTFNAYWTAEGESNKVTVTFSLGEGMDGKNPPAPQTVEKGEEIDLPTPEVTKDGYEFKGWTDEEGTLFFADEPFEVTENVTLTAQWEKVSAEATPTWLKGEWKYENPYTLFTSTINFDGTTITYNDGFETPISVTKFEYTDESVVTFEVEGRKYKITKISETQIKLEIDPNGSGWIDPSMFTKNGEVVEKKQCTVTFNLGDYEDGETPEGKTVEEGDSITLPDVKRVGYKLDGWKSNIPDDEIYEAGTEYTVNSDVTFTAQWSKVSEDSEPTWLEGEWTCEEDNGFIQTSHYLNFDGSKITYSNTISIGGSPMEPEISEATEYEYNGVDTVTFTDAYGVHFTIKKVGDSVTIARENGDPVTLTKKEN